MIPVTVIWTVWKERNRKAFHGIDGLKGFDVLKNRWFKTLDFLLMGHPPMFLEAFRVFRCGGS